MLESLIGNRHHVQPLNRCLQRVGRACFTIFHDHKTKVCWPQGPCGSDQPTASQVKREVKENATIYTQTSTRQHN